MVGAALSGGLVYWLTRSDDAAESVAPPVTVVERVETEIVNPVDTPGTATAVARAVLPSIVTVETTQSESSFVPTGSGSGVVLESDGLLVTNQHVVRGAEAVRVVFADGRTYPAEIVGGDDLTDVAVLRIDAAGFTPIEIGSSDDLEIGDTAIAVGSPLGLGGGPSVTVGVVSAFDRRVRTGVDSELYGMLQTDAPITRGSSGGALVDDRGRLIGITTAIGVSDVGAEGLGFAIPVELMSRIVDDLVADGEVSHAFLGIQGSTYSETEPDGADVPSGVLVNDVIDGTAAAAAGLQAGDIIRSFDGEPVVTMEQLVVELRFYRVGDVVELSITRNGADETIDLTLLERPEGV
jgi:S1-C subfamily serine protease